MRQLRARRGLTEEASSIDNFDRVAQGLNNFQDVMKNLSNLGELVTESNKAACLKSA